MPIDRTLRTLCLFAALTSSPALYAQTPDPLLQLVDMLKANGTLTEQQHAMLADAIRQRLASAPPPAAPPDDGAVIVRNKGSLEVTTMDGEFSTEIGGTLMIDAARYFENANELGSGTELRRAKIGLEGTLFGDWGYEFDIDFSDDEVDIDDAYIAYNGLTAWSFRFGQHKEHFSLEEQTSIANTTFMERALPNELVPGRAIGVSAGWRGEQITATGGLFAESADSDPDDEFNEGWGASGRLTFAPYATETRALHFGAALAYREPDEEQEIRLESRAETHITGVEHLDTGKIKDVTRSHLYGVEAAWVKGPVSLQGEWMELEVERRDSDTLSFDGWYLQFSWFLTGESRDYQQAGGNFGRVRPIREFGAVELAGRFSELDLNDLDISGGRQNNLTLGLNWYLNPNLRMAANYIIVNNDLNADQDGDVAGDDDFDVMQLRMQYDF